MIYKLDCNRFILMGDDIKKLAKIIKEQFGISNIYRIEGDAEEIDIYAYDNFNLSVINIEE